MDLLEYGMKNRKSKSLIKRGLAELALGIVKKTADIYETEIEKEPIYFPDESEEMLQKLREEIDRQSK